MVTYKEFTEAMGYIDQAVAKCPDFLGRDPQKAILRLLWEHNVISSEAEFYEHWGRFSAELFATDSGLPLLPELPALPPATEPIEPESPLEAALSALGASCTVIAEETAPSFRRYRLKPKAGVRVAKVRQLSDDLQVALGTSAPPMVSPGAGYIALDVPRLDRQFAPFSNHIRPTTSPNDAPVLIPIGLDMGGNLIQADLSDPNTCHWLIAGTTGSGKSEWLKAAILSLCYRHTPAQVRIALIDPKRVEFIAFRRMPWLHAPVCCEAHEAIALMSHLETEMDDRYRALEANRVNNIQGYNLTAPIPMARIVCFIDEFADLITYGKEEREALEGSIKRLGAKARAAGIHLIIGTQRPDATVVTPLIRSNLPGRIGLRVKTEADSQIVFGSSGFPSHQLLGKGDLLTHDGDRIQSLYVGQDLLTAFHEKYSSYEPPALAISTAKPASDAEHDYSDILLDFLEQSGGECSLRDAYRFRALRPLGKDGVLAICEALQSDCLLSLSNEGSSLRIRLICDGQDNRPLSDGQMDSSQDNDSSD